MDDRMDNFADDLNHIALDLVFSCPRKDSNLRTRFRKPTLYPLSYGGGLREGTGGASRRLANVHGRCGRDHRAAIGHERSSVAVPTERGQVRRSPPATAAPACPADRSSASSGPRGRKWRQSVARATNPPNSTTQATSWPVYE